MRALGLYTNMESSIALEGSHCKSNSNTVSKANGSFIQIDSISIDLVSAMDKNDAEKCEHFSIRAYVSEIRKKDWKKCYPFSLEGDQEDFEKQKSFLPSLDVPKFRWWRCQNCLSEVAAKDDGTLFNHCNTTYQSNSSCSHVVSQVLPSGVQATKPVLDGRPVETNMSTKLTNDNHLLLGSDMKEKKAEVANDTIIGHDVRSEDNDNQEVTNLTSTVPEANSSMIQESHINDTVALKSKFNGSVEFYEQGSGRHGIIDIELADGNHKCIVKDSAELCQAATQTSPNDNCMKLTDTTQTYGLASIVDEKSNAAEAHSNEQTSLGLDELDPEASESAEVMFDDHLDKSGYFHRRKTRKVRLLTELLGENGDAKNDNIETNNPVSSRNPGAFGGSHMLSMPQHQLSIQGNIKRIMSQNRKRKLLHDEEWMPSEIVSRNNSNKKVLTGKGDAEETDGIMGNELKDAVAGNDFKTDMKAYQCIMDDRNPPIGKNKYKKMQVADACLPLAQPQVNVQKEIENKIGNTSKSNPVDIVSFRLSHDAFTGSGTNPCSPLALGTERRPDIYHNKNKNPQVDGSQASLFPWTNGMLRNDPFTPKNLDFMPTGAVTVPFQPPQDPSTEKGLPFSLNSPLAHSYKAEFIPRVEDGLPSLSRWQDASTRGDQFTRKNVESNRVGDSNAPLKSPPDSFHRKGVNSEYGSKIANFRMPLLNGMQNCTSWVEEGGCSQSRQMGYSGVGNYDKSINGLEHAAFEKKNSHQKTDDVPEQGASDDIPMEIVELMAKHQYERGLHDAQNKEHLTETTNSSRNVQMLDCRNTYGNGELMPLQDEITRKRKSQERNGRNGIIRKDKNVGPTKNLSVDYFSNVESDHLNVSYLDQTQTPAGFRSFSQSQKKPSSGVQFSASGSSRHGSSQNCKWNEPMVGHRPSHASLQTSGGCNTNQTAPQRSEAAVHVWSSMNSSQMPFAYKMPQTGVAQSTNIDMLSLCSDSMHMGNMNSNNCLKFLNLNPAALDKHNMSCGSETFSRTSTEFPLACKHHGVGLPQNLMGPLDLYSNETIPAMHLLSLMDAGMRSGPTFNMSGTPEFHKRTSFPHDHKSEFPRMDIGAYKTMDATKQPSPNYGTRSHFSDKSPGCFHCSQTVGASPSSFQHDKSLQRGSNFTGQGAFKSREKNKTKGSTSTMQSRGHRSEKVMHPSGSSGTNHGAIPVHSVQKKFLGASGSSETKLQYHGVESSTQCPKNSSVSVYEICTINRNPADFCTPRKGSAYMIRGEDLKFGKVVPSQSRPSITNLDGRKRQTKHSTAKERLQH